MTLRQPPSIVPILTYGCSESHAEWSLPMSQGTHPKGLPLLQPRISNGSATLEAFIRGKLPLSKPHSLRNTYCYKPPTIARTLLPGTHILLSTMTACPTHCWSTFVGTPFPSSSHHPVGQSCPNGPRHEPNTVDTRSWPSAAVSRGAAQCSCPASEPHYHEKIVQPSADISHRGLISGRPQCCRTDQKTRPPKDGCNCGDGSTT